MEQVSGTPPTGTMPTYEITLPFVSEETGITYAPRAVVRKAFTATKHRELPRKVVVTNHRAVILIGEDGWKYERNV